MPPRSSAASYPFTGSWSLDVSRSDVPSVHLEALGLPDMAQIAASKIEVVYNIVQEAGPAFTITHQSILGEKSRRLVAGEELREHGKDGTLVRFLLEVISPACIRTTIDWAGRGKITDTKTIVEGGGTMQQTVEFSHKSGKRTSTTRFFTRVVDEE